MLTPWERAASAIRKRSSIESHRARSQRRPTAFSTGFEPLENRSLMTAAPSIPYWSGYWSVSSPGLQKNAYIDGDTYNLDMDYGWFNVTLINYSTGAGFSFFPDQTQNTDNATISGILTPENFGGGTTLGTFSFTANPNSSPDTVPDSFSGTYTLTGGQPIPISGTFEAPPNNPSLTSAVDEYGSTDPRARPINPTPPPTPPPPTPSLPADFQDSANTWPLISRMPTFQAVCRKPSPEQTSSRVRP